MLIVLLLIVHFLAAGPAFAILLFANGIGGLFSSRKDPAWHLFLYALFWELFPLVLLISAIRRWWFRMFNKDS